MHACVEQGGDFIRRTVRVWIEVEIITILATHQAGHIYESRAAQHNDFNRP
jgi:hypothetical protein